MECQIPTHLGQKHETNLWFFSRKKDIQMNRALSKLMAEAHAERVVFGFHIVLTAVIFIFLGMQLVVK